MTEISGDLTTHSIEALLANATPGPWEVTRLAFVNRQAWGVNGYLFGSLRGMRGMTWGEVGGRRLYQGDHEADARLIAATPDLAREVVRLRRSIESHRSTRTNPGCGNSYLNCDQRLWDVLNDPEPSPLFGSEAQVANP